MGERQPAWFGKLTRLGKLRDAFLVLVVLLYAIGYVLWALHAWRHNLGRLPALETQYLVAGLPVALLVLLAWGFLRVISIVKELEVDSPGASKTLYVLAGLLLAAAIFRSWQTGVWRIPHGWRDLFQSPAGSQFDPMLNVLVVAAMLSFMAGQAFAPSPKGAAQDLHAGLRANESKWDAVGMWGTYLLALVVVLYAISIYPLIPQAWGGVAPRCADVTLQDGGLDGSIAQQLWGENATQGNGSITGRVLVYFDSGSALLVKPWEHHSYGDTPTYELRRDAINAIRWCA